MWKDSAFAHNVRRCSGALNSPLDQYLCGLKQPQLPPDMGGANGKVAYIGTAILYQTSSSGSIELIFAL